MIRVPLDDELALQQLAHGIRRRGWRLPALVALEAGRPLAFLAGQLLWVAQPAITLFWPSARIGHMARMLEQPGTWETLITFLEAEQIDE